MVEVNVRTPVTFLSTFLSLHSFYSKHTGNDTYRALTENAVRHLAGLPTPLPGKTRLYFGLGCTSFLTVTN